MRAEIGRVIERTDPTPEEGGERSEASWEMYHESDEWCLDGSVVLRMF